MREFTSFLKSNLDFIQETGLGFHDFNPEGLGLSDRINIYRAQTGKLSIKFEQTVLHSVYDPEREARRFALSQKVKQGDHLLVYGFGLGYHIKYLLDCVGPEGKVVIFEPNGEILFASLVLMDFRDLFRTSNARLITGSDEEEIAFKLSGFIAKEFAMIPPDRKKVIIHLPSFQCCPKNLGRIRDIFDLLLIDRKASEVFGDLQNENFHGNLELLLRSPSLLTLKPKLAGRAAFFVNSGPSLDHSYRYIKKYASRAVVFASSSAFPFLVKENIPVDVVFSVDPQPEIMPHFAVSQKTNTLLIGLATTNAAAMASYPGPKMCVLQQRNSVSESIEPLLQEKTFTSAGGSVSCIGLDLMLQLAVGPIFLFGMDYAFPSSKYYFSHGVVTRKWYDGISRFHTVEMMHHDVTHAEDLMAVEAVGGGQVMASKTLYLYRQQFQGIIAQHPRVPFFNVMSLGARITGSVDIATEAALKQVLPSAIIEDRQLALSLQPLELSRKERIQTMLQKKKTRALV